MNRPFKFLTAGTVLLSLSACFTPQAARDAGKLMAKHTTTYKTSLEDFATKSNTHRAASATNIGISDTWTSNIEADLDNLKLEWSIAGKKTATSTLATLGKHATASEANPRNDLAFYSARRGALAARFGKVDVSTKKLAGPIKTYEALSKDDDLSLDLAGLLPLLTLIADTKKLDGTVAGDLLEKATKAAKEKASPTALTDGKP